ncbi:MAG: T9SS type A sorting domain-containing protein [Candidatus Cloacimonetes bacterium]|nr:T9SS type A sorting domain-containing protein [Candidatus Cloacimonadota bacterium]
MKRISIYFMLLFLFSLSWADRIIPDWDWNIPPQALLENYADYFQAYNETPVAVQPDAEGGIYIIYRVQAGAGDNEVYYTYIDSDGNITTEGLGFSGQYCDAEIDEFSGDPFACWHGTPLDGSTGFDSFLSYDLYNIAGSPGAWKETPITVIDGDAMQAYYQYADDEFFWPIVHIGASPLEDNQRVYLMSSNITTSHGTESLPCENVLLCYADFNADSLEIQSDLEWNYTSIPFLDALSAEDPYWGRPIKSWTVVDNQVIVFGYLSYEEDYPGVDNYLFSCVNENYGEGEWQNYFYESGIPELEFPGGVFDYSWEIIHTSKFNVISVENGTRVIFPGMMGLTFDSGTGPGYYNPLDFMIFPKTFRFDLNTHEFDPCFDVYPMGANPNDNIPMKPWDVDEDGIIDEVWAEDWPIFHYDPDGAFHYNQSYLTANKENGWLAYVWVDGLNAVKAHEEYEGFESWEEKPEIAICISDDDGYTWSDPIFMNANPESENYLAELDGMIPCYVYPGDRIKEIDECTGELELFFLDDYVYGSNDSNGSMYEFASIRIDFCYLDNDQTDLVSVSLMARNYPNPFNPETTIEFELQAAGDVQIEIYNVKGQKICTLTDAQYPAGKNSIVWKAEDVPSGVYFYKIKNGRYTTSKKMVLMK